MSREDYLKNVPFAPDWIVNPPSHIKKGGSERGNLEIAPTHSVDTAASYAHAVLDKLAGKLANETTGGRNDALNRAAFTLGGFVTTGAISREEVVAALTNACHRNGLVKDDGARAVEKTVASGLDSGAARPIYPGGVTAADDDCDIDLPPVPPSAERSLADLTHPPGLVGEIIDWIEASAEFPSRELALPVALGWVGTLAGRGFETPSRARTNLYAIALAPSGYGKDHAIACINMLAAETGLERLLGPDRFMSASALRETLMSQPSLFCILDEFGGTLRQIDGPKVGVHNEMIREDLLKMFSRAKDSYAGASYAAKQAERIYNPNLSLVGLSTPDAFWSAVSSSRSVDGFLARFLLLSIDSPKSKRVKPHLSASEPPVHLIEASQALYRGAIGTGNLARVITTGAQKATARTVPIDASAEVSLDEFERRIEVALEQGEAKRESFLNRAREHALKLALTVAVGVDPENPAIDRRIMDWAIALSWVSTCDMIRETATKIADTDRQAVYNRVLEIVRKAGPKGLPKGRIVDRLGGSVPKYMREEILDEAILTGRIFWQDHKPAGLDGGRPSKRYVAREFFVANDNARSDGNPQRELTGG